jgi:uncharacterized protein
MASNILAIAIVLLFSTWDPMNSTNFLNLARQGKNQWWRYLIGILIILIGGFIGELVVVVAAAIYWISITGLSIQAAIGDLEKFETWLRNPNSLNYVILNLPFIIFLFAIFIVVKYLHKRPFGTLISRKRSPNWKRIFAGFWVWGLLSLLSQIPLYLMNPPVYKLTASWNILSLLPVAFILTPLQTSAEEFFFRGYLLQGMGLLLSNRIVLCLLNGILFTIPHLANPEMARNPGLIALNYLSIGIFFAYITLRDQSLDLALGVHAANNLSGALLVNTEDSVLPTQALITITDPEHPAISLLVILLMIMAFHMWFFSRKSTRVTDQPLT